MQCFAAMQPRRDIVGLANGPHGWRVRCEETGCPNKHMISQRRAGKVPVLTEARFIYLELVKAGVLSQ